MQAESFCASYSIYNHACIYIFTEVAEIRLRYMIINASEKSYWTIVACSSSCAGNLSYSRKFLRYEIFAAFADDRSAVKI